MPASNTEDHILAEALLSARRMTDGLRLGKIPTPEELDTMDRLLRKSIETVDAGRAYTNS